MVLTTGSDLLSSRRGKHITTLSRDALAALESYPFPGNIRELENVIEHAYVFCSGPAIDLEHLPERIRDSRLRRGGAASDLVELERRFLRDVLERHRWNRSQTAEALGIHRTTLQRRIRRLGLRLPPVDGRVVRHFFLSFLLFLIFFGSQSLSLVVAVAPHFPHL